MIIGHREIIPIGMTEVKKKGLLESSILKIKLKTLNIDFKKPFMTPTASPLPTPQSSPGTSPREEKIETILPLQDTLDIEKLKFSQHNSFSPRNILQSMKKEVLLPRKYFEYKEQEKPRGRLFKFKVEDLNNINLDGKQQMEIMLQRRLRENTLSPVPSLYKNSPSPLTSKQTMDALEEKLLLARSLRSPPKSPNKSPNTSPRHTPDTKICKRLENEM